MLPEKKISILSFQRCGSSFLVSALNSHRDINCAGELFCRDEQTYLSNKNIVPDSLLKKFINYEERAETAVFFLNEVVSALEKPKRYFAFKLLDNQARKSRPAILKAGYLPIVLFRSNLLAVYSSQLLSKETGIGHLIDTKNPEAITNSVSRRMKNIFTRQKNVVKFSESDFLEFIKRRKFKEERLLKFLKSQSKDYYFIDYSTDLCGIKKGETLVDLQKWLGLVPLHLTSFEIKRHSANILSRFENPLEVIKSLNKIGKKKWIFE